MDQRIVPIGAPIKIVGTQNFRSTAGYPATGGTLRADGLFRSEALDRLDDDGVAQFAKQGISRVIDLRGIDEAGAAPNRLPSEGVEEILFPMFEDGGVPAAAIDGGQRPRERRETPNAAASNSSAGLDASVTLASLYVMIAEHRAARLTEAVRLIADAPAGGVLVHCTAGKDRTGMVVATALLAVGVAREQVLADYETSGVNLAGAWADRMINSISARIPGEIPANIRELVLDSPAPALAEGLDALERAHGSAEAMLRANGFDDATMGRLRDRLVAA